MNCDFSMRANSRLACQQIGNVTGNCLVNGLCEILAQSSQVIGAYSMDILRIGLVMAQLLLTVT